MLSHEEIVAAEAEKMLVMPEHMIDKYNDYCKINAQAKILKAKMDAIKEDLRAYAEEADARSLIDPVNARAMVTLTQKTRVTADKELMIAELGSEVVDMYFKPSTFVEMRIN